uniref:WRKY domain-containing protein n=1 Tax=Opuntia streptacantha TaxID=393608 RepID=A0A7C9EFZ2_OPUST
MLSKWVKEGSNRKYFCHYRSYYRCTYRNLQGCCAIKQVQRNDEDPSVFDITYKGRHTCTPIQRSKSTPTSPEKHERNKHYKHYNHPMMQQQQNVLLNFQRGLNVDIQNLESQGTGYLPSTSEYGHENPTFTPSIMNDNSFFSSYSPSFIPSPANSTSNYFARSPCNVSTYRGVHSGQQSELDIAEMISAASSGTNTPIIGIDFPLEQLGINSSFPFDNQAFFPSFSQPKE